MAPQIVLSFVDEGVEVFRLVKMPLRPETVAEKPRFDPELRESWACDAEGIEYGLECTVDDVFE